VRFWREQENTEHEFRWRPQVRSMTARDRHAADSVEAAFALNRARLNPASAAEQCGLEDDELATYPRPAAGRERRPNARMIVKEILGIFRNVSIVCLGP
jgi:hypothetical protein